MSTELYSSENKQLFKMIHGECLEEMAKLPDASVDLVLCDLPYGTTECKWDCCINLKDIWDAYHRTVRPCSAIVLTSIQPFSTCLINSNMGWFKYSWVWEKSRPSGFAQAKNKPLTAHEDVLVFSSGVTVHATQSKNRMPYFPQGLVKIDRKMKNSYIDRPSVFGARKNRLEEYHQENTNYPRSVLKFDSATKPVHPTQKPVALMEYIIKTYTNEGMTVLDNCMGSGTTGVACANTGRSFIGIEKDAAYYAIAKERVQKAYLERKT